MRGRSRWIATTALLALTSCGGGGSGGGSSVPVVAGTTPTPTPSPTPTPTATTYRLAFDPAVDQSQSAQTVEVYAIRQRGFGNFANISSFGSDRNLDLFANNIAYTSATEALGVRYGNASTTFARTDIERRFDGGVIYRRQTGAQTSDYFAITKLRPSQYVGIALQTIVTVEDAGSIPNDAQSLRTTDRSYLYGARTLPPDLPQTGMSRYDVTLSITGYRLGEGVFRGIRTEGQLTVDHVTGRISSTLRGAEPIATFTGETRPVTLVFSGTLDANSGSFTGTITSPDTGYVGRFTGSLYGPAGVEIGMLITAEAEEGQRTAGLLAGRR